MVWRYNVTEQRCILKSEDCNLHFPVEPFLTEEDCSRFCSDIKYSDPKNWNATFESRCHAGFQFQDLFHSFESQLRVQFQILRCKNKKDSTFQSCMNNSPV